MEKLLVIVGPTATGKTDLGLNLAKEFDGEIVSADSRQVYQGMDVGTGKELTQEGYEIEKEKGRWVVNGIPLHLYDLTEPDERFSVAEYQQLSYKVIEDTHSRGKLPILVGGTGLYVQAVTEGLKIPKAPPDLKLREKLERKPLSHLVAELEKVDPETAKRIDEKNPRRLVRALEVYYLTGQPISKLKKKFKVSFDSLMIGLTAPREVLYERADKRTERWFEKNGFLEEVRELLKKYSPDWPAMSAIGYRQVALYLSGKVDLKEAIQRTKFDIHGYIRRQLSWFKRDNRIFWFDISQPDFKKEVRELVGGWYKRRD
jgi:tRNA dimethylallyltransferase